MERQAFELLAGMERSWWYRGRARVVESLCDRYAISGDVLDYGAGSGGMCKTWKKYGSVYGFEPDPAARAEAVKRGYVEMYGTEEGALSRRYSLIAFCDVIEHIQDDRGVLSRANSALDAHGLVVITVPAFQWLWSAHDVSHHHFRRYSRQQLRMALEASGFEVIYISYWNATLFLPAALLRLFGKTGEGSLDMGAVLNALFLAIIRIEAFVMRLMPLPFGTSVVALAKKRE